MSGGAADPLPAVAETDAAGETAALYDDIRATLGVPVVNLVWRHLATFPGALPWCWAALKPVYESGAVSVAADGLKDSLDLPVIPPIPTAVLRAAGVDADGEAQIRTVLASYNRSNAMNLIALTALVMALKDEPAMGPPPTAQPADDGVAGQLPPLLSLADMPEHVAALIEELNRLGDREDGRVMATMYRHLAHWPGFLAMLWALFAPMAASGRLELAIDGAFDAGRQRAAWMLAGIGKPDADLDADVREQLLATLARFTGNLIGKMIPIGLMLDRAMPGDD